MHADEPRIAPAHAVAAVVGLGAVVTWSGVPLPMWVVGAVAAVGLRAFVVALRRGDSA